jgi:hypothetical protein
METGSNHIAALLLAILFNVVVYLTIVYLNPIVHPSLAMQSCCGF